MSQDVEFDPRTGRTLLRLDPSLLPEVLARAVDLSTRPRPRDSREPDELAASGTVDRWWQLALDWLDEAGHRDGRMLEVVDAYSGLYLVEPDEDGRRMPVPTTPSAVLRLLIRLVARTTELDDLRPLPPDVVLPRAYG